MMAAAGLSWLWLAALLPAPPVKAPPPPPPPLAPERLELLRPDRPTPAQRVMPGAF